MDQPEQKLSKKAACREASSTLGTDISCDRLTKWLLRGVLNQHTKERFFLAYSKAGGQVTITRQALHDFIEQLNRRPPPCGDFAIGSGS